LATIYKRPTALSWAFSFEFPPVHAGNRRILRVPGGRRHGVYRGQFDPFLPSVL
jgi:hypothetical protein